MNNNLRLIITLALIAALATGLLAVINDITAPIIEEGRRERLVAALSRVIEADEFEENKIEEQEIIYFKAFKNGNLVGYVFEIDANGYGPQPIKMLIGLDTNVRITGIEILRHSETPGLGDRPLARAKLEQFIGQGLEDGIDFDIVSGATASSLGLVAGVNEAVNILGRLLGLITEIDFAIVPDGKYRGVGRGYGGEIEVEITISKGEITKIEILNHRETPVISDPALEQMPKRIIEEQSLEVDVVSGATQTSNAIKSAIRNALAEFFGGEQEEKPEPVNLREVRDGRYRGEGSGAIGPIVVEVVVKSGTIVKVEIISHNESDGYAVGGIDAINKMKERLEGSDTLEVDIVTDATRTSEGILKAIENALRGEPIINLADVQNGTYEGTGTGFFNAPVTVMVTVENGEITRIEFTDLTSQTEEYSDIASEAMERQLVGSNNLDVDVETGATGTSTGILEAVKNALLKGLQ